MTIAATLVSVLSIDHNDSIQQNLTKSSLFCFTLISFAKLQFLVIIALDTCMIRTSFRERESYGNCLRKAGGAGSSIK